MRLHFVLIKYNFTRFRCAKTCTARSFFVCDSVLGLSTCLKRQACIVHSHSSWFLTVFSNILSLKLFGLMLFFFISFWCCRWKTLQVFMGWLRLELCTIRWAYPTFSQTHWWQTLQMSALRESVFQERPSVTSYEETLREMCEVILDETQMLVCSPATRHLKMMEWNKYHVSPHLRHWITHWLQRTFIA